jgi:hypothetical protein
MTAKRRLKRQHAKQVTNLNKNKQKQAQDKLIVPTLQTRRCLLGADER